MNELPVSQFLDTFLQQISDSHIDIEGLQLDHIAHQASSAEDYNKLLKEFSEFSDLVSEEIIGGRRVGVFKLHEPIVYKQYAIPALELIEPREGQVTDSFLQHAEFIANKHFEEYIEQYPHLKWDTSSMHRDEFSHLKLHFENGMTLKFLKRPILELVAEK